MRHTILLLIAVFAISACTVVHVNDIPKDDADQESIRQLAESWIRNAPTYRYDGMDLTFQEYIVLESYPEQHVLTYTFNTRASGYGDRTGQTLTQAITPHTIVVRIVEQETTSAIIDDEWDELHQWYIEEQSTNEPETQVSNDAQLAYYPRQCENAIWEDWLAVSDMHLVAPTEEEIIKTYYSAIHYIEIRSFQRTETIGAVCSACGCPQTYNYIVTVASEDAQILKNEGWI